MRTRLLFKCRFFVLRKADVWRFGFAKTDEWENWTKYMAIGPLRFWFGRKNARDK